MSPILHLDAVGDPLHQPETRRTSTNTESPKNIKGDLPHFMTLYIQEVSSIVLRLHNNYYVTHTCTNERPSQQKPAPKRECPRSEKEAHLRTE